MTRKRKTETQLNKCRDKNKVCGKKHVDFSCGKFPFKFNTLASFKTQKRRVHLKPYACDECEFRSRAPYEIREHNPYYHKGVHVTCKECGAELSSLKTLKRHVVHGNETFLCDKCKFSTSSESNLGRHVNNIHSGVTYNCEKCLRKYRRKKEPTRTCQKDT